MSKKKYECELCSAPPTEDWTCHHHFGEHILVDYLGGRNFEISVYVGKNQYFTAQVTEEECPLCGRDMKGETK